ncbi:MAG: hypothetical protein MZV64_23635 [Ignavibacteriales bacterium]|nr:hypothetical protein [Ignavibacteriales bacterium]
MPTHTATPELSPGIGERDPHATISPTTPSGTRLPPCTAAPPSSRNRLTLAVAARRAIMLSLNAASWSSAISMPRSPRVPACAAATDELWHLLVPRMRLAYYRFALTCNGQVARWNACIGGSASAADQPPSPAEMRRAAHRAR